VINASTNKGRGTVLPVGELGEEGGMGAKEIGKTPLEERVSKGMPV
jgi:hypothetical protein